MEFPSLHEELFYGALRIRMVEERIQRLQRLAQGFDPVLRAQQAQFMHGFVPLLKTNEKGRFL